MLSLLVSVAFGLTLPGLPEIPLSEEGDDLVLAEELPAPLAEAGVESGWVLVAVDEVLLEDGRDAVMRSVARGPSRDVRLRFRLPNESETLLVGRRQPLVHVHSVTTLPWPDDLATPAGPFIDAPRGGVAVADGNGKAWSIDDQGIRLATGMPGNAIDLVPLFWELTDAAWVIDGETLEWGPESWAQEQLAGSVRLGPFGDDAGEHLVRITPEGIEVLSVDPPRGTPRLPSCTARVPETCVASGRQILAELSRYDGAESLARRHLEIACKGGVYRGCFEAEAVERPDTQERVFRCVDDMDAAACLSVAEERRELEDEPGARIVGMLDLTCELEGSGTLGERLRRLENVGEGCVSLAEVYDQIDQDDQALLALDRACVLGRAEACEDAQQRREDAFAARIVRECEDEQNPIAPSCVELGRLLQAKPVGTASVDDFGAFLRGCSLGSAEGCKALGDYVDRWGIDNPRVAEAEAQLRASCDQGEQRACMGAGYLLERHEPRSDAYGQALVLFTGACADRIGEACVAGASQRRIGTARKLTPEPEELWASACDLNDPQGCAGLAERQARSKDTWPDAFTSFTSACDLGNAHACSQLGPFVEQKHEPAYEGEQAPEVYLERGCDNGDPEGCYWLAERSLPKKGEPPEATYLLLETSCEGSYGEGCAALGQVHLDRRTSFDDEIASRHLSDACENGVYESCKTLGKMYSSGKGVERDRAKARELRQRFQLNADRKYIRLGASVGIPLVAGGELELVAPIPVGPAIAVSGQASYVPVAGAALVALDGGDSDSGGETDQPPLTVLGGMARLYPNNKARGLYVGVGTHRLRSEGGFPNELRTRQGYNAVVGIRTDSRFGFVGLETGIGLYGVVKTTDFDTGATAEEKADDAGIPLILPSFALSFGLAPI